MDTIKINLDLLRQDHWSEKENKNVERLVDFVQKLMNNHDFDYVRENFGNPRYKQHNRAIPDGLENLIQYVQAFAKRFPEYAYDVKRIHADNDHVVFHSHVTTKAKDRGNEKKGLNITDTWKLDNGDIIEHWDSIQAIDGFMRFYMLMTGGSVKNTNGIF